MVELYRDGNDAFYLSDNDYDKEIRKIEVIFLKSPFTDVINPSQYLHSVLSCICKYRWPVEYALMIKYFTATTKTIMDEIKIVGCEGYVYLIHSEHGTKIGKSKRPIQRIAQLQTQMPFIFKYIENTFVENCSETETYLHKEFASKRLNGEWFNLSEEDIIHAREILKKRDYALEAIGAS